MTNQSLLTSLALFAVAAALLLGVGPAEATVAGAISALAAAGLALAAGAPAVPVLRRALLGGSVSALRVQPRPVSSFDAGYAAFQEERYEDAVTALQAAIDADPRDVDACFYLGLALGELRRHAEAVSALKLVVEERPRDATAHYRLGLSLAEIGQYFSARRAMVEAIRLDPRITRSGRTLETAARWERLVTADRQNRPSPRSDRRIGDDATLQLPPSAA